MDLALFIYLNKSFSIGKQGHKLEAKLWSITSQTALTTLSQVAMLLDVLSTFARRSLPTYLSFKPLMKEPPPPRNLSDNIS
jgi:hypothetical protein